MELSTKHIKVLDCTLRDGGYINDFNFGDEVIRGIILKLIKSNIDVIECGFLKDGEHKASSSVFSNASDLLQYIPKNRGNSSLVAMVDYGRYDISQLSNFNGKTIDGIRDCFFKKDRYDALKLAEEIQKKGYNVYVQPVDILGYSDKELIELIERVNDLNTYAFSIVDTFGSMYMDDLVRVFSLIDHNLKKEVIMGFHSHNNMQLSFALSQKFAEISQGKRNVTIDCTVLGMGRGAGNTPTELVANYLNTKWSNYDYNLNELLDLVDIYMLPIQKYYSWGYDIPNYIAGIYSSHVHNVAYLIDKHNISTKDMRVIIESIDPVVRKRYDYDNLESLYVEHINHKIDDSIDMKNLYSILNGKKILILTPGKTLETKKNEINEFIYKNNVIAISTNFTPDDYIVKFSFFSNQKRLERNMEFRKKDIENVKLIITSNIEINKPNIPIFSVNYSSLIKRKRWKFFDNSLILLIRLLNIIDVENIYIAGADGFSENDNYSENNRFLEANISKETGMDINNEIKEMIQDIMSTVKKKDYITFITPTIYTKK